MKRGVFHIIGVVGLVLLTALTLPRLDRMEAREAQANGQAIAIVFGADTTRPDDPAFTMAEPLSGSLPGAPAVSSPAWKPAPYISIDQSSIDAMLYLLSGLNSAIPVALLLGAGCGFAERWISRKRRRTA